ncbi:MAG TPA: aldehyde dehydrogenase family protein, partial [Thermomicrobiales bacterium]|nr:aldehyde dehydrogenase family protein [Thermomicrobiales bacterium]
MAMTATRTITTINPATEAVIEQHEIDSPEIVDRKLEQAYSAFQQWRTVPIEERAAGVRRLGAALRANKTALATMISTEMGKPIADAEGEVEKSAGNCDYYADNGPAMLAREVVETTARESYVTFEPLGVILAVMPWNYPVWQLIRHAAPALVGGNVVVLKHASNVTGSAKLIEQVARDAGLPEGAITTLVIPGSRVEAIIDDPRIAAVTLTGSDAVGSKIAEAAGRNIKKSVLELGGSDAFIVLADADLDGAADYGARSRFQNAGQVCISAKRFIVVDSVADDFVAKLKERAEAIPMGSPFERTTKLGPMARVDLRDEIERQMQATINEGATLVTGGTRPDGPGYYFPASIVDHVTNEMTMFRQE